MRGGAPNRLLLMLALLALVTGVDAADASLVACRPDSPSVPEGGAVAVRAWTSPAPPGTRVQYRWSATAGEVVAKGATARWDLAAVRPGRYAATVAIEEGDRPAATCVLRVVVYPVAGTRGGPERPTGSSYLVRGAAEAEGYGLYSYFLLGAPPSAATRARYLNALEAYARLIPAVAELEHYVDRERLNIAYLPVTETPPDRPSAVWLLEHYDYARATALLSLVPGANRDGPYVLSSLRPPARGAVLARPFLFQSLSAVPPGLAELWIKEFLNQAAQERFWADRTGAQLTLKMRLAVGILAQGLPEVRKALDDWIAWVN